MPNLKIEDVAKEPLSDIRQKLYEITEVYPFFLIT